jgi:hypothetical protein
MIQQSRLYELQSFTGTPGVSQSLQYDIRGLPYGQRVEAFLLVCDLTVEGEEGNETNTETIVGNALAQFDHQSEFYRLRATGRGLSYLYHHMAGRALQTENVTLTGSQQHIRAVAVLPVSDRNQFAPTDCSIPTELFNGTSLQLNTSAKTLQQIMDTDDPVTGSIAYRLFACLTEGAGAIDPTPSVVDYEDWGGQTVLLRPGAYSHLQVYKEDGGDVNLDTGISRVTWNIASTPVLQNVFSWSTVLEYNRASVAGGFVSNKNEQLETTLVPWLPIYTPPQKYKLTGLPQTSLPDSILQFNGSETSFRVLYRRIPQKNESMVRAAAQAFGFGGSSFRRDLKTASKMPVAGASNSPADVARRSQISKLIPGRLAKK